MFGWFRAAAPLVTAEKAWTEAAMRRLADWFGMETLRRAEFVIPDEYAADFDGSEECAREIFHDVCETMGTGLDELRLEIVDDVQLPGASGHYDRYTGPPAAGGTTPIPIVRLGRSQLADLCQLTATIAHEVAHHRLLGGGFHTDEESDFEQTTDLMPIYFGYGLFAANATVRFTATRTGNWEQWSISRSGYLPSRIFGYALALAAAFRGERRPRWSRALRPDAKEPFDLGERYLATGDSLFHPSTFTPSEAPLTPNDLFRRLAEGSSTFCYDALVEFERRLTAGSIRFTPEAARTAADFLNDRDADVAQAAIRALSACDDLSEDLIRELQRQVWGSRTPVRATAIRALGRLGVDNHEMLDSLCRLLAEDDLEIVTAVAAAAESLGARASPLERPLLALLEQANIRGSLALADAAARTLSAVLPDPVAAVRAFYQGRDPELRMLALDAVRCVVGNARSNGGPSSPA
jgi:hypothetical protein